MTMQRYTANAALAQGRLATGTTGCGACYQLFRHPTMSRSVVLNRYVRRSVISSLVAVVLCACFGQTSITLLGRCP